MTTGYMPLTLDAGTVLSFSSMIPTTRRLFDPFKESEKIRENARFEYAQMREVNSGVEERNFSTERNSRERVAGVDGNRAAPVVGSTAPEGSVSLASLKPIMLR